MCWRRRRTVSATARAACDRHSISFFTRTDHRRFRRFIGLLAVAVLVAPLWAGQGHYDPKRRPRADINAALAQARTDKKLVLLDFGADWCLDCVVLSALFRDRKVAPYLNEHFHVVQIDIGEWNRNLDVSKEYGDPIKKGIPAVVVLSPLGSTVASTANGALSTARNAKASDVMKLLQSWVARAR
jgi:thiol-disulfide isomerase/thioredoxin